MLNKKNRSYSPGIIGAIIIAMIVVSTSTQAASSSGSKSSFSTSRSSRTASPKLSSSIGSSKTSQTSTAGTTSKIKSFSTGNISGTVSPKFGESYNSHIEKQYAKQSANEAFKAFKKVTLPATPPHFPVADLKSYRSRYSKNGIYDRALHDNDAWRSRNSYYQSHQPVVVNGGSNSFGLLTGMFLYSLLDNPASAGEYSFNHQRDEDYLKWRAEADRLAKDNTELSAQLSKMDAAKQAKSGTPNPDWLPEGVPASAALSDAALKSSQPDFNVCVGTEAGPYYMVAQTHILPSLVEWVNLNPIITGGTPDILAKIASGNCDAGFIQGDATFDKNQLEVVFKPFLEVAHLACSASIKGESITDLSGQALWIPKNSGSRATWDRLVSLNSEYGKIVIKDAVNYEDAIMKAIQTQACLFYMAAPHASSIDRLIDRKELKLFAINDEALLKDGTYQVRSLSSSDYSKTIPSHLFSSGYIQTVVTPARFVISNAWKTKQPELSAKISLRLTDIEKRLKQAVKQ